MPRDQAPPTPATALRRWAARGLDRLLPAVLGLRWRATDVTVTTGLRIPLRDGVDLVADLYRPGGAPAGTLLVRGPYGRGPTQSLMFARIHATRGYQVLYVSSRGTFGSGGEFDPMRTEAPDGQDVVAWMREQDWFTGTFATVGMSYLGHTQWALLTDPPPELRAAVVVVGPHDFARHTWGTGALTLDLLEWSDMIAHQEDEVSAITAMRRQRGAAARLRPLLDGVPLTAAVASHFGGRAPWLAPRLATPDVEDPYWTPVRHGAALDRATVPVLVVGGWQDLFLPQSIEQYTRLRARGVDVALTVGPWTHIATTVNPRIARETLQWLDTHLAGRHVPRRAAPVHVHVTGARTWRELPDWPPACTDRELLLQPGGRLAADEPAAEAAPSSFRFDPADPTPSPGGPFITGGGVVEDSALAARPDVLAFTGDSLPADLEVHGAVRVVLAHTSDSPHADLFVRLSDVDDRGRSRNVTEGYLRLDPARGDAPVEVDLAPAAHRFRAGHRVRVHVAGGCHPRYSRNPGTGDHPTAGSALAVVRHTVHHGSGGLSRLVLPVLEETPR